MNDAERALEAVRFSGPYEAEKARVRGRWMREAPENAAALAHAVRSTPLALEGSARVRDAESVEKACTRAAANALDAAWRRITGSGVDYETERALGKIAKGAARTWARAQLGQSEWRRVLGRCRARAKGTGRTSVSAERAAALGTCTGVEWGQIGKAPAWARATALEEIAPELLVGRWQAWVAEWANHACEARYGVAGRASAKSVGRALGRWPSKRCRPPMEALGLGSEPFEDDPEAWWAGAMRESARDAQGASGKGHAEAVAALKAAGRSERARVAGQITERAQAWCGEHGARAGERLRTIARCWSETKGLGTGDWRRAMRLIETRNATLMWEIPYCGPEPVLAASITGKGAAAEMAVNRALLWPLCDDAFDAEGWRGSPRGTIDRRLGERTHEALARAHAC